MMLKFAVVGDAGSSGEPSFLFTGETLQEVIEAAEQDWLDAGGNVDCPSEPLGEEGEYVYHLFEYGDDGWIRVAWAESLDDIRGWAFIC